MHYTAKNLYLSYSHTNGEVHQVLSDISLDIYEGDFIGLLGDSGSGKTQLVSSLANLNTFYNGTVRAAVQKFEIENIKLNLTIEKDLQQFREKYIGYIYQEAFSYFNPVKKVHEQILAANFDRGALLQMMDELNLNEPERILNSYPHELSGGQLQRIAILRCLLKKPAIVVADEIDSALDHTNAKLAMELISSLQAKYHFALIWITHDQTKAKAITNKIWLVEKGKLIFNDKSSNFEIKPFLLPIISKHGAKESLIQLSYISKSYKKNNLWGIVSENKILNNINLTIHTNEIIGLIGHSGSGKSTLGKLLVGIEKADGGEIYHRGKLIRNQKVTKEIIYLFQDAYSALNPAFTIKQILLEAIVAGKNLFTVEYLLKISQLGIDVLDKNPHQLSGGMRQRLALIRALAVRPDLLILDESLNAMDSELQLSILNILIEYKSKYNTSILIITHQSYLVKNIADTIYKIDAGSLYLIDGESL